jgi:hypothetical protein
MQVFMILKYYIPSRKFVKNDYIEFEEENSLQRFVEKERPR